MQHNPVAPGRFGAGARRAVKPEICERGWADVPRWLCAPTPGCHAPRARGAEARRRGHLQSDHRQCRRPCQELQSLRSEEHTSELQSLMRISYAVFCLKKKTNLSRITHCHATNSI